MRAAAGRATMMCMPTTVPSSSRYAVVWNLGDGRRVAGSLEVLPDRIRLDGRAGDGRRSVCELTYGSLVGVRIGRVHSERLDGRPALVLERRDLEPLLVGDAEQPGILRELAERLTGPIVANRG
jgi:hypothetical protein